MSRLLSACCLAVSMGTSAIALGAPSTRFDVSGAITSPTRLDLAALQARPAVTQTVTFQSGNSAQTHIYTGTSLWGILNDAGIVTTAAHNDVLNRYVLATGADGYRTVFSLGELSPTFGNRPDLVAYAETSNNVSLPIDADGFARITAPGDAKGGRYVSNLVDLDVRSSGSTAAGTGGGISASFSVSGAVSSPMSFDLAALHALTSVTEIVNGHSYTGVSFWDLIATTVGIPTDPSAKNDILSKYVVATGSDGYEALFSLGELSTAFGNQPDIVAYELDGAALGADGFARLVVPNDVRAGRWISNIVSLEVFTAAPVPEPETDALMLAGLIAMAAVRRSTSMQRALAGGVRECAASCRRTSRQRD